MKLLQVFLIKKNCWPATKYNDIMVVLLQLPANLTGEFKVKQPNSNKTTFTNMYLRAGNKEGKAGQRGQDHIHQGHGPPDRKTKGGKNKQVRKQSKD